MIPFRMYLIFKTRCNTYNILTYRFFLQNVKILFRVLFIVYDYYWYTYNII